MAGARLSDSNGGLRALLQNISDMILVMNSGGVICYESPSWASTMGFPEGSFIGKSLSSVIHPEDLPFVVRNFKGLVRHLAVTKPIPFRLRKADGTWAFVEASGYNAIKDPFVRGIVVTIRDISRTRQVEEVLRGSEERYRNILNKIDTGYFEVTLKGEFTFFNPAMREYLGYRENEMIGLNYRVFMEPEESKRVREIFLEVFRTGEPRHFTWRLIRKNGAKAHAMVSVYLRQNETGEATGFRGTSQEITALKEVEETLRASERRLSNIINFLPDATFVINRDAQVIAWNRAIEKITGVTSSEIVGKGDYGYSIPFSGKRRPTLADFALKPDEADEKPCEGVVHDGDSFYGEVTLCIKGELTVWWCVAATLRDAEGKIVGAIESMREITDRKKVERELTSAKEAADQANRIKGEFLANMSHEIRTPLNAIIGMTELALDRETEGEKREILLTTNREAEHLLQLINDTLVFSKIESGHFDLECLAFDLTSLLDDIAGMFALQCEQKELDFLSYLEPGTPALLMGDPGRLRQILINLVGNAVKFTNAGEVSIRCSLIEDREDRAVIRFSIKDTGIGIPPDKQKTIFESFTQADGSVTRKYGGTGLGTTISEKLVRLMGSSIELESEEGKGSTFWFDLNLRKQTGRCGASPAGPSELQGIRVLVADSHASNRMVLRGYLTSWGCEVEEAENADEVLERLGREDAADVRIDLALVDRQIPGTGGSGLADAITKNERWRSIPLLLITSMGQLGDGDLCRNLRVRGYLTKPIKKTDLEQTILKILAEPTSTGSSRLSTPTTGPPLAGERNKLKRILVVDDYEINRRLAIRCLKDAGYTVDDVENGEKAIEAWRLTPYDLILMDIQMPGMDGYKVTRVIRELESSYDPSAPATTWGIGARVPIIAVTAYALQDCRDQCLASGMDCVLTKPLRRRDLLDTVAKMLGTEPDRSEPAMPPSTGPSKRNQEQTVFNYPRALEEFGNDRQLLYEIASEFIKTADHQLQSLVISCRSGEAETIHRTAHSIKGGAANLRAVELSAAARSLEEIGKSQDLKSCPEAIGRLQIALNHFRETLERQYQ